MSPLKKASVLLLLLIPTALQAQAIGKVPCGARVFSTGFPASIPDEYFENGGPKMSKERRETALECIEWTFGKVKEYEEYWGDCTGEHIFYVKLESGDEIWFDDGCLGTYHIVSSRFAVGRDHLRGGGLRVGQKLNLKKSRGDWVIHQSERDPNRYDFSPQWSDDAAWVEVDENGIIQCIQMWTNDC